MNEGLDQLHVGNYDKALAVWQQLASREPNNALAANNIGVAYMMKHDAARAIPWFTKAQELDPSAEMTKNNLAWPQAEQAASATK